MNALEDVIPMAWDVLEFGTFFRQNVRNFRPISLGAGKKEAQETSGVVFARKRLGRSDAV